MYACVYVYTSLDLRVCTCLYLRECRVGGNNYRTIHIHGCQCNTLFVGEMRFIIRPLILLLTDRVHIEQEKNHGRRAGVHFS